MKKFLEGFIKILIYLTFFVPLIVLPSSFIFPFIVPKILIFRSLVEIMLGAYILLLIINWQEYRPKFTPVTIAVLLFLLSFVISTFVGVDPYHSFWDNHERMLGLFTIFHYVILYLVATAVFKNWKDWRKALLVFLGAGSIVMFIGLLQVLSPELLLNRGAIRVASTLGNSIYLSGYGLFLFFVATILFLKEKQVGWKYFEIVLGLLAFLGIFFGGSRGAVLGLGAGLGTMILSYAIVLKQKEYKKTKYILWGLIILGVLLVGLAYNFRQNNFVQNIPTIGRTFNTSVESLIESPRWMAWGIALESFKERPFFGWGPNNFFYAFNKHYNPKLLEHGYGETWFDNAHNIIMNTLAVQGGFGLLAYLSLFIVSCMYLIRSYKKGLNENILVVSISFLIAHLIQNITVFENPTSYLYFVLFLAFVSAEANNTTKKEDENKQSKNRNVGTGVFSVIVVFVCLLIFIFNIQPARANMKALQAIRVLSNLPGSSTETLEDALNFNSPHIDDIRSDVSRTVTQVITSSSGQLKKETVDKLYLLAREALLKNMNELHPLDIRNHLTFAQLNQSMGNLLKDPNYLVESRSVLFDALSKSPKRQQIAYMLSSLAINLNDYDTSIKILEDTIKLNPRIGESYARLAMTYRFMGNYDKARGLVEKLKSDSTINTKAGRQFIEQTISDIETIPLQ